MADIKGRYVTGLRIENYGRIVLVDLEFDAQGGLVEVTSVNNAQGKSTLLSAVSRIFGGAKWDGPTPIHNGADRAMIRATLDDGTTITVTEIIGSDGEVKGDLKVKSKEGLLYPSPQKALDKLYSTGLNPIEFYQWGKDPAGRRKQVETLIACVGLTDKLAEINMKIAGLTDERASANKEVARIKAVVQSLPLEADGTPDEEVTMASLQANLDAALEYDRFVERKAEDVTRAEKTLESSVANALDLEGTIKALQEKLDKLRSEEIPQLAQTVSAMKSEYEGLSPSFTTSARAAFTQADETNRNVRIKKERAKVFAQLESANVKADDLDTKLTAAREDKKKLLDGVEFPVAGLGFDDNGVTLNGLPFEAASEAEAIVTSTILAIRMNPNLRCMPVKGASGLGENMRNLIAKVAVEEGCQVIMERIVDSETTGIVIEDGRVKVDNRPQFRAVAVVEPVLFDPASEEVGA